ncbi:hypothetical protein Bbelb_291230 [Branchiostoma belcheri]|nr:hypothetical protein Bbelb_291230 [Branchiostoma belcheri]
MRALSHFTHFVRAVRKRGASEASTPPRHHARLPRGSAPRSFSLTNGSGKRFGCSEVWLPSNSRYYLVPVERAQDAEPSETREPDLSEPNPGNSRTGWNKSRPTGKPSSQSNRKQKSRQTSRQLKAGSVPNPSPSNNRQR